MENKIKIIKKNEKKIKEILNEKDLLLTDLGRMLVKKNIPFPGEQKKTAEISEYTLEIKNIRSEQEKIVQYNKRIEAINTEEKNALKKVKEINAENEKHFIGIGETVFSIYLERPGELFAIEDYLKDLIELKEKIDELDEKIENSERKKETENFLGKIFVSGTGTVLESRKKLLEGKYLSLYKAAGKRLCDDRYFETAADKEIKGIFNAFEGNLKVIEDHEIKLESLKAEKANYQAEIDEKNKKLKSDYNGKPDETAENKEKELSELLLSSGADFYYDFKSGDKDESESYPGISDFIKKISDAENTADDLNTETDKLKSEVEIDQKQNEINKLNDTVKNRQEKIKSIKKEIDKMNRSVKKLENEIEELKKK